MLTSWMLVSLHKRLNCLHAPSKHANHHFLLVASIQAVYRPGVKVSSSLAINHEGIGALQLLSEPRATHFGTFTQ